MRRLSFFAASTVGNEILYVNGLGAVPKDGLRELLKAVQGMVRDHEADLVVLDGMRQPGQRGVADIDSRRFIASLQE